MCVFSFLFPSLIFHFNYINLDFSHTKFICENHCWSCSRSRSVKMNSCDDFNEFIRTSLFLCGNLIYCSGLMFFIDILHRPVFHQFSVECTRRLPSVFTSPNFMFIKLEWWDMRCIRLAQFFFWNVVKFHLGLSAADTYNISHIVWIEITTVRRDKKPKFKIILKDSCVFYFSFSSCPLV